MTIREEAAADYPSVREVLCRAFAGDDEARLVEALRNTPDALLSLVAEDDGVVSGHILFSRLRVANLPAVSLAPVAVSPQHQNRGIGSALVREGLRLLRARGERIVIVLGHAGYYPRFGFSADLARPLKGPYGDGDTWMALELVPGALHAIQGEVLYPAAFRMFN